MQRAHRSRMHHPMQLLLGLLQLMDDQSGLAVRHVAAADA